MSSQERQELHALLEWLTTFPVVEQVVSNKENKGHVANVQLLQDIDVSSAIIEVASEICQYNEDTASTMGHSGDVWDTILGMTQKKQRLDPPTRDTPIHWEFQVPHAALAQLLDGAVAHKDLKMRKVYIERIMALSADTQRSLMSLIERRKKQSQQQQHPHSTKKTPKKPTSHSKSVPTPPSSRIKRSSPGEEHMQSPFSPYAIKNTGHSGTKSNPMMRITHAKPSPHEMNDDDDGERRSPRRSFEVAFGEEMPTPSRPTTKRSSFLSPGLGDTAEVEKQFQALKERNQELAHKLAKKEAKEEELMHKLEHAAATFRNQMMKVEADARRRDEDTRQVYQEQIDTLKEEMSHLQMRYNEAAKAQLELQGVKDEIDLLAHTKNQLAEAQDRLQTYREKVQQLADVKEALKREEEAHSKSVEECLRLENELKSLHPLKKQLEDYKTRAVEAEVRLTEVQDEFQKLKEQRWTTADASTDLERTLQMQHEEILELRMRLQQEKAKASSDAPGVGDGLSELNPELKEEVFRLRNENQQLQAFAAKREDDAVQKMEQELEDATRLGNRFKTQYLTTRAQLEQTQRNLQASRERESKLRNEMAEAMDKIKLTQGMVEDVSQQLYRCHEELNESRNRESELEAELAQWVQQAKELQETSNKLTGELRSCSNQLEESKRHESDLMQQLTERTKEFTDEALRHKATMEEQRETLALLNDSKERESDLQADIDQWKITADSLDAEVKTLEGHLDRLGLELSKSRQSEESLTEQLSEATEFLREANNKCEELLEQLNSTSKELLSTQEQYHASQKREEKLREDLSDMSHRAEDAETISKQRMDLLQSTRDKLKTATNEVEELKTKELHLTKELGSWTERAEEARAKSIELQNTLNETIQELTSLEESNRLNEQRLGELVDQVEAQSRELEGWKQQTREAEDLTERLQEELIEARDLMKELQLNLQSSQTHESMLREDVKHAEHMIFCLEETLDVEVQLRANAEKKLDDTLAEMEQVQKDFDDTKARLEDQLDKEIEQSNQYKQDLFHTHETLDEIQSSLGASQHREKMLKLEITKLQDRATQLEMELELAKDTVERTTTESALSLETTCEMIHAKAQQDIQEIQNNMNCLLEDERRAKRQADENYQRQLQQLRENFDKQVETLQETAKASLQESTRLHEEKIQRLRDDYETELAQLKKSAEDQNTQLVTKGKGMLKDVRQKAAEEIDSLRSRLHETEQSLEKEKEEKGQIIVQAKTKVATYKKKLEFASSRINTLTSDTDELESRVKNLEREKFKLVEENDRYRRQLGGRGGPDSKLQSQLELLQKEFKSAMEEARELRRKLKEKEGGLTLGLESLDTIDENCDPSYSRDAVNQSTLVQLRTEYEETIEALNDEKRELVMKNSAAATDVQKAEKRAWESEQENATLKQQITSLQLQVERLEQSLLEMKPVEALRAISSSNSASSESQRSVIWERPQPTDAESPRNLKLNLTDLSSISEERGEFSADSPTKFAHHDGGKKVLTANKAITNGVFVGASKVKSPESSIEISKLAHELPSFVQLHDASNRTTEGPPECKQC